MGRLATLLASHGVNITPYSPDFTFSFHYVLAFHKTSRLFWRFTIDHACLSYCCRVFQQLLSSLLTAGYTWCVSSSSRSDRVVDMSVISVGVAHLSVIAMHIKLGNVYVNICANNESGFQSWFTYHLRLKKKQTVELRLIEVPIRHRHKWAVIEMY